MSNTRRAKSEGSVRKENEMTPEALEREMERLFSDLHRDLDDHVPATQVTAVSRAQFEALSHGAAINDFIPLLVHRYTKETLVRSRSDELHNAA
jgi:hypothetical protein